mmetsp:Transcript_35979/g.34985  ORF Transcript_35979/g.34985 Transcript_35979/m.34985 type:complete len:80 (+) Transcript_35979:93-332(+)
MWERNSKADNSIIKDLNIFNFKLTNYLQLKPPFIADINGDMVNEVFFNGTKDMVLDVVMFPDFQNLFDLEIEKQEMGEE